MVRIISCHHFVGQKIGKCEEAVGVAVAQDRAVIVALEHQVNIYTVGTTKNLSSWFTNKRNGISFGRGDLGKHFTFETRPLVNPGPSELSDRATEKLITGKPMEAELILSHFFAPVDLISTISYNPRGHYLLCMERRDTGPGTGTNSVRVYFQWDRETKGKPMKARIAGLVSPVGGETDEEALMMVEIPPQPLFATRATTSCSLSGNIATLSMDSRVSVYAFRMKQSAGRAKIHYADFDLVCTLHFPGFAPESISFVANFIGCLSPQQASVVRIIQSDSPTSPAANRKDGFDILGKLFSSSSKSDNVSVSTSVGTISSVVSVNSSGYYGTARTSQSQAEFPDVDAGNGLSSDTVVFNSKDESVKVYLNSIKKANRKKRQPNSVIREDFQDDITTNKTTVVVPSTAKKRGYLAEDILRVTVKNPGTGPAGDELMQIVVSPIRIKEILGGTSCVVATSKEAFLYHLPEQRGSFVIRVSNYPFTAPLIRFTFDSLFLHALTDTGLETYSSRGLYYALRDTEGYEVYKNDCPFKDESPCLLGIRPFLGVRHITANRHSICMLTSPSHSNNPVPGTSTAPHTEPGPSQTEDNLWTIYSLDLPNMDFLYKDMIRSAELHKDSSPDAYFTLLSELHLLLRFTINTKPESELKYRNRYRETCKLIGLEYFKKSTKIPEIQEITPEPTSEDLTDQGVTYLQMGNCDLHYIFSPENQALPKDPALIPGISKFITVTLPKVLEPEFSSTSPSSKFSPTLTKTIVDFLNTNSPETLIDIVITVPWLRECQGSRLLPTLRTLAETQKYRWNEALALILTIVSVQGSDTDAAREVKNILKLTDHSHLVNRIEPSWLLEKKDNSTRVTDLAICLSLSGCDLQTKVLCRALKLKELFLNDVVVGFAQGVNLTSEAEAKQGLTQTMCSVLEHYFLHKLKSTAPFENGTASPSETTIMPIPTPAPVLETEDEIRALHALVRSYLSHITITIPSASTGSTGHGSGSGSAAPKTAAVGSPPDKKATGTSTSPAKKDKPAAPGKPGETNAKKPERIATTSPLKDKEPKPRTTTETVTNEGVVIDEQKFQIFGNIPTFISVIVPDLSIEGRNPSSTVPQSSFPTSESKEYFIRLTSLLGSPLGSVKGVSELVGSGLKQKGNPSSPVHVTLQLLTGTPEKAIDTLMGKYPTALMLYGKELFGKKTKCWKTLVLKLKEKINSSPPNVEVFSTVIESVYLHLANTLSPTELEEVLDKEEENAKFHSACKRVELANHFTEKVVKMSKDFLEKTQKH